MSTRFHDETSPKPYEIIHKTEQFLFPRERPDSQKAPVPDLDLAQVTLSLALRASQVRSSRPESLGALSPPQSQIGLKTQNCMGSGGAPETKRAPGEAAVATAPRAAIPKTMGALAKVAKTGATKT